MIPVSTCYLKSFFSKSRSSTFLHLFKLRTSVLLHAFFRGAAAKTAKTSKQTSRKKEGKTKYVFKTQNISKYRVQVIKPSNKVKDKTMFGCFAQTLKIEQMDRLKKSSKSPVNQVNHLIAHFPKGQRPW